MKKLLINFISAILFLGMGGMVGAVYMISGSSSLWSANVNDPLGDAPSGYDIVRASASYDGSIFSVEIEFTNSYATSPYSGMGVRIETDGTLYILGFGTSPGYWGPQLLVSYDGGTTWQFASGSFGGNISGNIITLWVNMSDIGALPWTIDFISGIVFSLTAYEIKDSTSSLIVTVPPTSGVIQLPKTGQTTCYDTDGNVIDCTVTGQDGEIQAGVEWPEPRFTENNDGTITDNLTGLMWLKDGNCFGYMNWQNALNTLADFNTNPTNYSCQDYTATHTDWRLPNVNELESLVNADEPDTAVWLNTQGFINVQFSNYWTATTSAYDTVNAWVVHMWYGYVYERHKIGYYYPLWPVRTDQSGGVISLPRTNQKISYAIGDDGYWERGEVWPEPRFTDNENGTVTDNLTGLMWLKDANCVKTQYPSFDNDYLNGDGRVTWQHAFDFIEGTNNGTYSACSGGYSDWRLPNREELRSLVDYSNSDPALPTSHPFINVESNSQVGYWSSTTNAAQTTFASIVRMFTGYLADSSKSSYKTYLSYVWPVRGGQVGSYSDFSISGTVTYNGSGLENVSMALSGAASQTTLTAPDGTYSFIGPSDGNYTITPSLAGYSFNPSSINVTISGASVTGQDFRACDTSVPLSGVLRDATTNTPLSGVTVTSE